MTVAPRAGAWIETPTPTNPEKELQSLPVRGVDRNWMMRDDGRLVLPVAPRAGAWIETAPSLIWDVNAYRVAPRAGAWIETPKRAPSRMWRRWLLPVRGRGSKMYECAGAVCTVSRYVTPGEPGQDGVAGELGPSPKGREGRVLPSLLDQLPKRVAMMVAASAISLLRPSMSSLEPVV